MVRLRVLRQGGEYVVTGRFAVEEVVEVCGFGCASSGWLFETQDDDADCPCLGFELVMHELEGKSVQSAVVLPVNALARFDRYGS